MKYPKEQYTLAAEATWMLPIMFSRIADFRKTLAKEPHVPFGTPDPYQPAK